MKLPRGCLAAIALLLVSCWDIRNSPNIENDTSREYVLSVESSDNVQNYRIEAGSSLLLPNILKEKKFKSIKLASSIGDEKVLSKKEIIELIEGTMESSFLISNMVKDSEPKQSI